MFDPERFISQRLRSIDASGIRRVFDLAAALEDPINLAIGQPDFDVPDAVKAAAIGAIESGFNRYTVTQGTAELRERITSQLRCELPPWGDGIDGGDQGILITSGVSGGLVLALLTCVEAGDEVLLPDPFFVMYRHLVTLSGATPVFVDTYPDFQLTAERVLPHLTERSRLLLLNWPSNPTGVVATDATCRDLVALAESHNLLLLSDEIYDLFCYDTPTIEGLKVPTVARHSRNVLLMRGFSKSYAMTGWRLGYVAGPTPVIEQMTKLQQYSFVCAPSMAQVAGVAALQVDMAPFVEAYGRKRDRVVERLGDRFDLTRPGGAFYAFPAVPKHLGQTGTQFTERAIEQGVLVIPGSVFSERDSHFRLSYACDDETLDRGLDVLLALADS